MQILVIAVGEFGVNVASKFFQNLVIEHNLLDKLNSKEKGVELHGTV
jgi:hypothetical protein